MWNCVAVPDRCLFVCFTKDTMEKAEVVQKLIIFTSEISILIFFASENITFWNMHVNLPR